MRSTEWLLYTLNFSKQQCEYDLLVFICVKLKTKCNKLRTLNVLFMEYKTASMCTVHVFACVLQKMVYQEDWELHCNFLNRVSMTISSKSVLKDVRVKE